MRINQWGKTMSSLKKSTFLLYLTLALLGSLSWISMAAAQDVPVIQEEGEIQEIDIPNNNLVIDGVVYSVALDAKVEIGGSYGAFTLLQPGMKADFSYRMFDRNTREIFELSQLPDSTPLQQM